MFILYYNYIVSTEIQSIIWMSVVCKGKLELWDIVNNSFYDIICLKVGLFYLCMNMPRF
jgi:hypothetical protein